MCNYIIHVYTQEVADIVLSHRCIQVYLSPIWVHISPSWVFKHIYLYVYMSQLDIWECFSVHIYGWWSHLNGFTGIFISPTWSCISTNWLCLQVYLYIYIYRRHSSQLTGFTGIFIYVYIYIGYVFPPTD